MTTNNIGTHRLGALLVAAGDLSETALNEALAHQARTGRRLGEAVVALGHLTEERLIATLSRQLKAPLTDPTLAPPPATLLARIPASFARRRLCVPVALEEGAARIALADPLDLDTIDELAALLSMAILPAIAAPSLIEAAIDRWYDDTGLSVREARALYGSAGDDGSVAEETLARLLRRATGEGASDLHFEPQEDHVTVRLRVDGLMRPAFRLAADRAQGVMARIKVMAGLDIAEARLPQDGGMTGTVAGVPGYELRVASFPTVHGESLVIRLLAADHGRLPLASLGMSRSTLVPYRAAMAGAGGMVVVTGPTGAGKTTTLYATLAELAGPERTVVTIEDPVERRLPHVRQSQVNRRAGFTFPVGVKHALRQDPDIVMVGEIRDAETAAAATQAAMTGHLCITSLHTADAVGVIDRLVDLGVERYQVAAVLRGAVSQRLVRTVCAACRGDGCQACRDGGYRGRAGVFAFLPVDAVVSRMIREGASAEAIAAYATESLGMTSLADDAARKVADGSTTAEEVERSLHGR
jgi:type II secretory ATPase GspE/PulE/Tfp pilus assembly ATPase PilB-like protein